MMTGVCSWQPVISAIGVAIGVLAPGVLALLIALSNRATINRLPVKRSSDAASKAGGPNAPNT